MQEFSGENMVESPGRITLWGIEIFVAAAEESSISAAAKRLSASPSAISQQISNLEAGMGAIYSIEVGDHIN